MRKPADLEKKSGGYTEFPSEVLECDCYRDGAGWRLRVEARVDAVMHVDHTSIVIHERRHLLHLDELLTVWLEKMAVPVFATEPRCRAIGRLLSRPLYVTAMMNDLRMSSNLLFQCSRTGEDGQPAGLLALDEGTGWSITGALRTRIRFRRNRFRRLVQPACGVSSAG